MVGGSGGLGKQGRGLAPLTPEVRPVWRCRAFFGPRVWATGFLGVLGWAYGLGFRVIKTWKLELRIPKHESVDLIERAEQTLRLRV